MPPRCKHTRYMGCLVVDREKTMSEVDSLVKERRQHAASLLSDVQATPVIDGGNKYGDFTERVKWVLNTIITGVALITLGAIEAVGWLMLYSDAIFTFL